MGENEGFRNLRMLEEWDLSGQVKLRDRFPRPDFPPKGKLVNYYNLARWDEGRLKFWIFLVYVKTWNDTCNKIQYNYIKSLICWSILMSLNLFVSKEQWFFSWFLSFFFKSRTKRCIEETHKLILVQNPIDLNHWRYGNSKKASTTCSATGPNWSTMTGQNFCLPKTHTQNLKPSFLEGSFMSFKHAGIPSRSLA